MTQNGLLLRLHAQTFLSYTLQRSKYKAFKIFDFAGTHPAYSNSHTLCVSNQPSEEH